jgi:hypothetical protein
MEVELLMELVLLHMMLQSLSDSEEGAALPTVNSLQDEARRDTPRSPWSQT